jgi:succinyl-CoA synthetase beta subunit
MVRLLEDQAKKLLARFGIPVPNGYTISQPDQALCKAELLGCPVVIKALIPRGGRARAGLVRFANTPQEAYGHAKDMLGKSYLGFLIEKLLIERKLDIAQELFCSITFDFETRNPVMLFSVFGGVDVEELISRYPTKLQRYDINIIDGVKKHRIVNLLEDAGLEDKYIPPVASICYYMYELFRRYHLELIEITILM